jgi:hypothetical protein
MPVFLTAIFSFVIASAYKIVGKTYNPKGKIDPSKNTSEPYDHRDN